MAFKGGLKEEIELVTARGRGGCGVNGEEMWFKSCPNGLEAHVSRNQPMMQRAIPDTVIVPQNGRGEDCAQNRDIVDAERGQQERKVAS